MAEPCNEFENNFDCEKNLLQDEQLAALSASLWDKDAEKSLQNRCKIDKVQVESGSLKTLEFSMDFYQMNGCDQSRKVYADNELSVDLNIEYLMSHPCPLPDSKYEEKSDPQMINKARAKLAQGDPLKEQIFNEYGAVFAATDRVHVPTHCIFESEADVKEFQSLLDLKTALIDGKPVELQALALRSLLEAIKEAKEQSPPLRISPRQTPVKQEKNHDSQSECQEMEPTEASLRSYQKTKELWDSRVEPGLKHWQSKKRLSPDQADEIRMLSPGKQVAAILELEREGSFFSRDFKKSILHSVAAPGSSQHIAGLAIDIAEHDLKQVREIMSKHGWYQTVRNDAPHFTYLGVSESQLEERGLEKIKANGERVFWVPKR